MAWEYSRIHEDFCGAVKRQVYSFSAASVTSGSIVTGLSRIIWSELLNKTGVTADQAVDDTTTAGTVAISGLTSNDAGYVVVYGI